MKAGKDEWREQIRDAKRRLPLPELLRTLGFPPPPGGEGNMQSPFAGARPQKTPSFSIFQRGAAWGWCDRTGGGESKGDEITLLEKLEGLSRADAIARYLALAGVETEHPAPSARNGAGETRDDGQAARHPVNTGARVPAETLDWPAALAKFTAAHAAKLAESRGYSRDFATWLHAADLVGLCKENTAFPVHDEAGRVLAAHIRPTSGRWFYTPKGIGARPLLIGEALTATKTLVFESQWDAFAIMDAMGWHKTAPTGWAVLITRGASNGRFASHGFGKLYAWPQNDVEKDGKRAGEEWLRDVTAHAPGEIFRVAVPAQFKDANDWTRAGAVDVSAALDAASRVERPAPPATAPPKSTASNGARPPARPFDAAAILDELGLWWLNGSSSYFLRREENRRLRFLEMGTAEIRRKLRVRGIRSRPDTDAGESVAPLDKILDAATELRAIDFAANIGGTPAGVYDLPGGRVLVRESPRLIEPVAGIYPTITALLTGLLGDDGMARLCAWLTIAFTALRAGKRRPGQALIIVGPPDCGKSRIQHQIITPILGGRSADPKSFFFGRTDFNAELIGAEHLLIEEIPASSRHEERQFFGERIKEIVANDTARLHKKNRDAVTVSPFWRLSITLNDNPEKLRCLPLLTDDLSEKIIMLQAKPAPEFWARFSDASDMREAFLSAIERELPAFAHDLATVPVPQHLEDRRYGLKSFIPDELARTIFEGEPEHHLWLLINKGIFPEEREGSGPWSGDAEDLKGKLCADGCPVRASASRLLGSVHLSTIGTWLRQLKARFPTRFDRHRKGDERTWIIHPPAP